MSDYSKGTAVGVGVGWSADGELVYTRVAGDFGEIISKEAARAMVERLGWPGVGPLGWQLQSQQPSSDSDAKEDRASYAQVFDFFAGLPVVRHDPPELPRVQRGDLEVSRGPLSSVLCTCLRAVRHAHVDAWGSACGQLV